MKTNIVIFCLEPKIADSVGKLLAEQLEMFYLNTTELFKFDHIPHTIEEFIEERGERGYRELEKGTVSYSATFYNTVIVVDSGAVKSVENIKKLQKSCYVVYVEIATSTVKKKLEDAIYDNKIMRKFYDITKTMLISRAKKMESFCEIKVNGTRKSDLKICSDIIRSLKTEI